MNFKLRNMVAATLAGSVLMGFGTSAMADSTFDLVQALVSKGVLTEEEALPLLKGRENDIQLADKKVKKAAKLSVSDAIDNATLYGDVRVRAEYREGSGQVLAAPFPTPATDSVDQDRTRTRYKLTFGAKTTAGDFYSDVAFAMGGGGRSDNATFGTTNGANNKEALLVKRAMLGWNVTDWLALEAGRLANPLYTTSMVWDGDLTVEGLAEKANFTLGTTDVFLNAFQAQYEGDRRKNDGGLNAAGAGSTSNELLAFQGGAKFKITDNVSAKAALTYYTYTNDNVLGNAGAGAFRPGTGNGTSLGTNPLATNDLQIIEIPGEINFKLGGFDAKVFGDYAYNIDGDDRYKAALDSAATIAAGSNATLAQTRTAIRKAGNDDQAWLIGFGIAQKQDKKPKQGDWSANLWYQDVGAYSLDPNTPDSDFFDSRVNMKGIVLKSEYALRDNVFVNFAAGHASRKNDNISAVGSGNDITLNLDSYNLYQLDMTYKF